MYAAWGKKTIHSNCAANSRGQRRHGGVKEGGLYSPWFWFAFVSHLLVLSNFSYKCWPLLSLLLRNVYSDHLLILTGFWLIVQFFPVFSLCWILILYKCSRQIFPLSLLVVSVFVLCLLAMKKPLTWYSVLCVALFVVCAFIITLKEKNLCFYLYLEIISIFFRLMVTWIQD